MRATAVAGLTFCFINPSIFEISRRDSVGAKKRERVGPTLRLRAASCDRESMSRKSGERFTLFYFVLTVDKVIFSLNPQVTKLNLKRPPVSSVCKGWLVGRARRV